MRLHRSANPVEFVYITHWHVRRAGGRRGTTVPRLRAMLRSSSPGAIERRLERICRYALRPPVAHDRIHLTEHGQVRLDLRHRWADGTTHLLFEPVELLERLAALTPRPRINLVLYYGVLGARSAWRSRLAEPNAGSGQIGADSVTRGEETATAGIPTSSRPSNLLWAQLMQRSFGFDVLACPRCEGRLQLIAVIEEQRVIRRILGHLGLPTEVPVARAPRAPPIPFDHMDQYIDSDSPAP